VVLDEKKKVITTRGREFAMKDPEGAKYPWRPQVRLSTLSTSFCVERWTFSRCPLTLMW
jgi:hypothetical protein